MLADRTGADLADAIVDYLHRVRRQDRTKVAKARIECDDNGDSNSHVDEVNEQVMIFDLTYRPSEVLFAVDHEAYRDLLIILKPGVDGAADEVTSEATGDAP